MTNKLKYSCLSGLSLVLLVTVWIWQHWYVYGNPKLFLPNDSITDCLMIFVYLSNYMKHVGFFPEWYIAHSGGIWLAPLSNTYQLAMPYKWIAHLIAYFTDAPLNSIFKLSFILLGVSSFLFASFLLALRLLRSFAWATLFCVCLFLSPAHIGILHEEHLLATIYFIRSLSH